MKKWIPNEMLTDEPENDSDSNSFRDVLFQRTEESVIRDPVTKEELEVISDIVVKDDGGYVMRFSVAGDSETFYDEFDDRYITDVSYNVDVPLEVIGDPSKEDTSQIIFDIDKGIDVYSNNETYSTTPMGERSQLVLVEKDNIPDAMENDFKRFASKLDESIREVGFDVFDTNIVKEVEKPKQDKKEKKGPSLSM